MRKKEQIYCSVCKIFFVVNTADYVGEERLVEIQAALRTAVAELRSGRNANTVYEAAILEYSDICTWRCKPTDVDDFSDGIISALCVDAGRREKFDCVLQELSEQLSRTKAMYVRDNQSPSAPVVLFIGMGEEDLSAWGQEAEKLKQNRWYDVAFKAAFAFSAGEYNRFRTFFETDEAVFDVSDFSHLQEKLMEYLNNYLRRITWGCPSLQITDLSILMEESDTDSDRRPAPWGEAWD